MQVKGIDVQVLSAAGKLIIKPCLMRSAQPALRNLQAGALQAPVMIQANGARKGADPQTWPVFRATSGLQDIWQLHYSLNAGPEANPPEEFIANLEGNDGFKWIKIEAARDGSFTVTNSRNSFSKHYKKEKT